MCNRESKDVYYLRIAREVARRSTCIRRRYGAVIVNHDEIISTGYNGAPRGRINCIDSGICLREQLAVPHGERYELCRAVHAEQNAIISAGRSKTVGGTLYLTGFEADDHQLPMTVECCRQCKRFIINAGISKVVTGIYYPKGDKFLIKETDVLDWVKEDDIVLSPEKFKERICALLLKPTAVKDFDVINCILEPDTLRELETRICAVIDDEDKPHFEDIVNKHDSGTHVTYILNRYPVAIDIFVDVIYKKAGLLGKELQAVTKYIL